MQHAHKMVCFSSVINRTLLHDLGGGGVKVVVLGHPLTVGNIKTSVTNLKECGHNFLGYIVSLNMHAK
jgi:hypothetical protein